MQYTIAILKMAKWVSTTASGHNTYWRVRDIVSDLCDPFYPKIRPYTLAGWVYVVSAERTNENVKFVQRELFREFGDDAVPGVRLECYAHLSPELLGVNDGR